MMVAGQDELEKVEIKKLNGRMWKKKWHLPIALPVLQEPKIILNGTIATVHSNAWQIQEKQIVLKVIFYKLSSAFR